LLLKPKLTRHDLAIQIGV